MLYDNPSGVDTPFIPPSPTPESIVLLPSDPTPNNQEPPSWVPHPRTPMNYPYNPSTPYNTTPFIPPMLDVHDTSASQLRPETPASYYPAPSILPVTPRMPTTSLGGLPTVPVIQVSADFTGYPTSLSGTPWAPPPPMPPPAWAFDEGPHYGPVLESFQAKIVNAAIQLNPLLAPPPNVRDDYLRWNMLSHASECHRTTESQRSWTEGRNAPATHPRLSHIRIVSRPLPWIVRVCARNTELGVTCGEVLNAISTCMHGNVTREEYERLSPARKRQIWEKYRFNRANPPGARLGEGLKRLDWLGDSSWFGGLVVDEELVRERCGDALPCTFALECLSTAEEMRGHAPTLHRSVRGDTLVLVRSRGVR